MKTRICRVLSLVLFAVCAANASAQSNIVDTVTVLTPNDPTANAGFGDAVAMSGDWALIGAPGIESAYFFQRSGLSWIQRQKAAPGTHSFGVGVAIQNDLSVVGGRGPIMDVEGTLVYTRIGSNWGVQDSIAPNEATFQPEFAMALALDQKTIAAGAQYLTNALIGTAGVPGGVYVFVRTGTNWVQQALLVDTNASQLGSSVALQGDTLLAGSRGAAYVYVRNGTTWTVQQILTAPDAGDAEFFGFSAALQGDVALVGAPFEPAFPAFNGAVYVFRRTNSSWTLTQKIVPSDTRTNLFFGWSLAMRGALAVVGTGGGESFGFPNAAYIYEQIGGTFVQEQTLTPPLLIDVIPKGFGFSVGIGEAGIIVGAPFSTVLGLTNAGSAYVYTSRQPVTITSASASPNVLFPPNHKFVPVTVSVSTSSPAASCRIASVSSNQPINGTGDGNTSPDWIITGDLTVLLRAERAGNIKTDRVYTITVECADTFGNTTTQNVLVTVPHDQGK